MVVDPEADPTRWKDGIYVFWNSCHMKTESPGKVVLEKQYWGLHTTSESTTALNDDNDDDYTVDDDGGDDDYDAHIQYWWQINYVNH